MDEPCFAPIIAVGSVHKSYGVADEIGPNSPSMRSMGMIVLEVHRCCACARRVLTQSI